MKGIPITISLSHVTVPIEEGVYLLNKKETEVVDLMCLGKGEVLESPEDWQPVRFIAFVGHDEPEMTPVLEHNEIVNAIYTAIDVPTFVRDMRTATVFALEVILNKSGKAWLKKGRNESDRPKLIKGVWEKLLMRSDKFVISIKDTD